MSKNLINTLVIGGAGYIGSYLVPQLVATGRRVTVLGRGNVPRYELPRSVVYVAGDFSNQELIVRLLNSHQEVVHLAYATVPNTSFANPLEDLLQNLPAAVNLFSEIADRGVKLILVSSGGTVYGEANELPIKETHSTRPISPYGVTKLTLENYAYLYALTHNLKYVCVRPANAYGVGQKPFSGQGFISTAMASAIKGLPVKIFGSYGAERDYLYVSDVASGIVSALECGRLGETYNIGSGVGFNNFSIVEKLVELMDEVGFSVSILNMPERAFDVRVNVLSSEKIREHTGWMPRVDIDDGLRLTFEWLRGECKL